MTTQMSELAYSMAHKFRKDWYRHSKLDKGEYTDSKVIS
jgi:hypothetical protein